MFLAETCYPSRRMLRARLLPLQAGSNGTTSDPCVISGGNAVIQEKTRGENTTKASWVPVSSVRSTRCLSCCGSDNQASCISDALFVFYTFKRELHLYRRRHCRQRVSTLSQTLPPARVNIVANIAKFDTYPWLYDSFHPCILSTKT